MKDILLYNSKFVEERKYEPFCTSKFPDKKIAILSCMDSRLTDLLPAALGLKHGEAIIIKNAGGIISHAFGSIIRSLLIAVYELGVEEIAVIGHTDCGVQSLNADKMMETMIQRGIAKETIDTVRFCSPDFEDLLQGFENVNDAVSQTVEFIRQHPLIPEDIKLYGFVMDTETGKLEIAAI